MYKKFAVAVLGLTLFVALFIDDVTPKPERTDSGEAAVSETVASEETQPAPAPSAPVQTESDDGMDSEYGAPMMAGEPMVDASGFSAEQPAYDIRKSGPASDAGSNSVADASSRPVISTFPGSSNTSRTPRPGTIALPPELGK